MRASGAIAVCLAVGLIGTGCSKDTPTKERDQLPDTIDDDPTGDDGTTTPLPQDTAAPILDDVPEHLLHVSQFGQWELLPAGGPYTTMSGILLVEEIVDELKKKEIPDCQVTYALTGSVVEPNQCATCDFVFAVEHYTSIGDESLCRYPDTPVSGDIWKLGFVSADSQILFNYNGSGTWLPWYTAAKIDDQIDFEWFTTVAVTIEEEDE